MFFRCVSKTSIARIDTAATSTLSGMIAFSLGPLITFLCGVPKVEVAVMSILGILVLLRHRKNIREEIARIGGPRPVKDSPVSMHKGSNDEV